MFGLASSSRKSLIFVNPRDSPAEYQPKEGKMNNFHAFPVWQTIVLGNGARTARDFAELYREGRSGGSIVDDPDGVVLGHSSFKVADTRIELDLVLTQVRDLGFTHAASSEMINRRAVEMGLALCPVEAPFQAVAQIRVWRNILGSSPAWFMTERFFVPGPYARGSEALFYITDDRPDGHQMLNIQRTPCAMYSGGYFEPNTTVVYIRPRS